MPKAPDDVRIMAEELVRTCVLRGVYLTGFIFGDDPPFLMHIGTLNDSKENIAKVHKILCDALIKNPSERCLIHLKGN